MTNPLAGWNRYEWSRDQLISYLNGFTGEGDITVTYGQGSSHIATKTILLPIGDPDAADTAAHEGVHIKRTDNDAWQLLPGRNRQAEGFVLNALEDARMELAEAKEKPGLFVQWQLSLDRYMPIIVEEDWLLQSIKGIYMECGGYKYPRASFKPKARKLLTKFDTSGIKYRVRRAPDTASLVPIVAEVLALFDEAPKGLKHPTPQITPEEEAGKDEPSPFGLPSPATSGQGNPAEADGESSEDGTPTDGAPTSAGSGEAQGNPEPLKCDGSLTCAHCNALEKAEREEGKGVTATRKGEEYSADDARTAQEMARKHGVPDGTGQASGTSTALAEGEYDKVTGGPSVNRLMERAKTLDARIRNFEKRAEKRLAEEKDDTQSADTYRPLVGSTPPKAAPTSGEAPDEAPDAAKPYANTDRLLDPAHQPQGTDRWGRRVYDWDKLLPALSHGGTGYSGVYAQIHDARSFMNTYVHASNYRIWAEKVLKYEAMVAAVGNYLGRQMRIWLQSQDRSALRDHERSGIFDPRRGYQMALGNFDVYRNPPKNHPAKPVVTLSVDMSSSMYGNNSPEGIPNFGQSSSSFHAVMATWLMARGLYQVNVPFEVIGFGGSSDLYMMKPFEAPYNDSAKAAIANIATMCSGGTPAAEGLALSWVRALTRPEKRKIVIQVTDAHVSENTRKVADQIREQGGIVIGVGIGSDDSRIKSYYGDGFSVDSANQLPPRFVALLRRLALTGKLR